MAKTYRNVSELLRGIGVDKEFCNDFDNELQNRKLTKLLFALRHKVGLTQSQVADKAQLSQSKLSKIENGKDEDLSIGELLKYSNAIDHYIEIHVLPKKMKTVDKIKYHIYSIGSILDQLTNLAKGDKAIIEGVAGFIESTLFNLLDTFGRQLKNLSAPDGKNESLKITSDLDFENFGIQRRKECVNN